MDTLFWITLIVTALNVGFWPLLNLNYRNAFPLSGRNDASFFFEYAFWVWLVFLVFFILATVPIPFLGEAVNEIGLRDWVYSTWDWWRFGLASVFFMLVGGWIGAKANVYTRSRER